MLPSNPTAEAGCTRASSPVATALPYWHAAAPGSSARQASAWLRASLARAARTFESVSWSLRSAAAWMAAARSSIDRALVESIAGAGRCTTGAGAARRGVNVHAMLIVAATIATPAIVSHRLTRTALCHVPSVTASLLPSAAFQSTASPHPQATAASQTPATSVIPAYPHPACPAPFSVTRPERLWHVRQGLD